MKITQVKNLSIPEIKVIKFGRFLDHRGYFTEVYRKSDLFKPPEMNFFKNIEFVQSNESFSKKSTLRGMHFQWNPFMGKLVRTIQGHMIDLILDIRLGSPTLGKIIAFDMPTNQFNDFNEWIWIPPGFAHGNIFLENTLIEYFCSGEYNQECEAGISPLAKDIDWSLCDTNLKEIFDKIVSGDYLITEKDRNGFTVGEWKIDECSKNFIYDKC